MSDQVAIPAFVVREVGTLRLQLLVAQERIAELEQQLEDAKQEDE